MSKLILIDASKISKAAADIFRYLDMTVVKKILTIGFVKLKSSVASSREYFLIKVKDDDELVAFHHVLTNITGKKIPLGVSQEIQDVLFSCEVTHGQIGGEICYLLVNKLRPGVELTDFKNLSSKDREFYQNSSRILSNLLI